MPPQMVDHSRVGERHAAGGHDLLPDPGGAGDVARVKCVLVGDGAIGKTSLVVSYTTNGYPTEYVPTAFDNYAVVVTVDNKPIRLQLCDTAGQLQGRGDQENQDDFDSLRPLCYPSTDIFLLCFSVVSPTSFHNLTDKWLAEIRHHCPKAPIIIVGTQCDLRNDVKVLIELAHYNERPVTENEARALTERIGALTYIECSALTQRNLKEVFDSAILAALDRKGVLQGAEEGRKTKKSKHKKSDKSAGGADMWSTLPPKKGDRKEEKQKKGWKKFCCFV